MLTCQQLTEIVTDYLEGRLSFVERLRVQLHLGTCGRCLAFLRQMEITVRALGKLPAEAVPSDVLEDLLARFRTMRPRGGASSSRVSWPVRFLAALESGFGSQRGWLAVGLVLVALTLAILSGGRAGTLGGEGCLVAEIGAGMIPLVLVGFLAGSHHFRVSPSAYATIASLGALGGYAWLQFTCGMSLVAPHVLVFHIGGVAAAAAMGALASRLPALR